MLDKDNKDVDIIPLLYYKNINVKCIGTLSKLQFANLKKFTKGIKHWFTQKLNKHIKKQMNKYFGQIKIFIFIRIKIK